MAIKIPQNIDKEDKLVGPLTLKQFLYILGAGSVIFIIHKYYVDGYLYFIEFIIISTLIAALAISLAFLKINGRPFIIFLGHVITYVFAPKIRFWVTDNKTNIAKLKITDFKTKTQSKSNQNIDTEHGKVEKLARILDTGGKINAEEMNDEHEINTIEENKNDSATIENNLGVEDILADVEN